jgi:hypothetical protein
VASVTGISYTISPDSATLDFVRPAAVVVCLAACGSSSSSSVPDDAYVNLDAPARPGAGPGGGLLDNLSFAVVGDTRPANLDDTASYPTEIVRAIWTAVEAENPKPPFAVTTGDYMFASTGGAEVGPQLDLYLGARASYSGIVYPTMGNHECNGYTNSNCGPGKDGAPPNYTQFLARMIAPLGEDRVWYAERFAATDGSWTAKFVFTAANAWNATQQNWFELVMSEPTTYTFVIRHEPHYSETAPGVDPSQQIMARHPLTMLITGHTHSYAHVPAYREIIVGTGGAPLSGSINYGYVIITRQPDGTLAETTYDYATHAVVDHFIVNADGTIPR